MVNEKSGNILLRVSKWLKNKIEVMGYFSGMLFKNLFEIFHTQRNLKLF